MRMSGEVDGHQDCLEAEGVCFPRDFMCPDRLYHPNGSNRDRYPTQASQGLAPAVAVNWVVGVSRCLQKFRQRTIKKRLRCLTDLRGPLA